MSKEIYPEDGRPKKYPQIVFDFGTKHGVTRYVSLHINVGNKQE